MGLRSCTRHTLPDHAATSIKLSEEPSAFETAWQPASSRVGPSPIRQRRPQAKAAGLLQALKWEQRWQWWSVATESGWHDWGPGDWSEDEMLFTGEARGHHISRTWGSALPPIALAVAPRTEVTRLVHNLSSRSPTNVGAQQHSQDACEPQGQRADWPRQPETRQLAQRSNSASAMGDSTTRINRPSIQPH